MKSPQQPPQRLVWLLIGVAVVALVFAFAGGEGSNLRAWDMFTILLFTAAGAMAFKFRTWLGVPVVLLGVLWIAGPDSLTKAVLVPVGLGVAIATGIRLVSSRSKSRRPTDPSPSEPRDSRW